MPVIRIELSDLAATQRFGGLLAAQLKAGDVIAVREKSKSVESITNCLQNSSQVYEWITWNDETMEGTYVSIPERIQIPENINEQYIVELYSK